MDSNSKRARLPFGPDVAAQFNYNNKLDFTCRGHQLVMEGY